MVAISNDIEERALRYYRRTSLIPDWAPTMVFYADPNSTASGYDRCVLQDPYECDDGGYCSITYADQGYSSAEERKELERQYMRSYVLGMMVDQRQAVPIRYKSLKLNHIRQVKLFQKHNCKIQNRRPYK